MTKKKIENRQKRRIEHWEIIALYLVLYDIVAVNGSYFIGLLLRFDLEYSSIPINYLSAYVKFAPVYTIFVIGVFYVLKLYNSLWRFASFSELNRILTATVITTVFHVVGITGVFGRMPFAYYSTGCILQFLFAVPTASAHDRREILNICSLTKCELKSLPGVYQLANGEVSLSKMKAVAVEDLLGRDPIKVNMEEIFQYLQGKTILVTGGGGSIGSELCRQIAGHNPRQLIIFDIYENNAYNIEQELKRKYKDLNLVVLIGSVRDSRRINQIFETYHPDIV